MAQTYLRQKTRQNKKFEPDSVQSEPVKTLGPERWPALGLFHHLIDIIAIKAFKCADVEGETGRHDAREHHRGMALCTKMRFDFIGCEAQFLFGHGHHCSPSSGGSKALSVTDNAWKPRGDGVSLHSSRGGAMVKTAHIAPRIARLKSHRQGGGMLIRAGQWRGHWSRQRRYRRYRREEWSIPVNPPHLPFGRELRVAGASLRSSFF
jgi:hypothetical protein